jgi:hypothetical protein
MSKRILFTVTAVSLVFALSVASFAERPKRGQNSPWQYLQQMIGNSLVEVEYSRPGVKGRTVWGELVPYDELWRAGANERTVIAFEDDVLINGAALPAGDYALFILPTKDEWTFIFNRAFIGHGVDGYDEESDVLRVTSTPTAAEHEEWLQFGVTDFAEDSATIYVHWEKVRCGFKVELVK